MNGFNLSGWALANRPLMKYFLLAIVISGAIAYAQLGRSEDPPFTIKTMVVRAAWPGASTADMLAQVTDRLEKKLEETPHLDYLQSYTKPGETVVFVNVLDSIRLGDVPDVWYQVRKKIADIESSLPDGVQGPYFDDEFGDTYGIIFAFTSDGFSHRELRDHVDAARTRLLGVKDVEKVILLGAQEERVWLEFSPRELAGRGLDTDQIIASLQAQNAIVPAGVIDTGAERIQVRVSGEFISEESLRSVNLNAGGRMYRLSDIVDVRRGLQEPAAPEFRFNGAPALGLAISMAAGGDIEALGAALRDQMRLITAELPIGIDTHLVADQSAVVNDAVRGFLKVLAEAIAIVIAVSFFSLGLRAGVVVMLAIPLVLAMTFAGMHILDIDLQRISLGALIISLGLLVDDAMITVEMMISRLEEGDGVMQAMTHAYTSTAFPMLTGTLVTIAGFLPVGLARSGAGEYCFSMFLVIMLALVSSWFVAVLFCPLVGEKLLGNHVARRGHSEAARESRWLGIFRRVLLWCMRRHWLVIVATAGLFLLSLAGAARMEQQFFPSADRPELMVNLILPRNVSVEETQREVQRIEAHLQGDPDVVHFSFYVGSGAVRFYLPMEVQLQNQNFAQAVVVTRGMAERDALQARLEKTFAAKFDNAIVRALPLEMGPPVGWPVKIRVSGPDAERVRALARDVARVLGSGPGARNVNFDWMEPTRVLRLAVDQVKARQLGVTSAELAESLNTVVTGVTVTELRDATYLVPAVARAGDVDRRNLDTLRSLRVALPDGRTVPVSEFTKFEYALEDPVVWRRNRVPTITVLADTAPGALAATIVAEARSGLDELRHGLPPGYSITVGGTQEESARSQASLAAVVPLMLLVMLTLLMIQLRNFHYLVLVLSVAPLGIIGIVAAMLPTGTPMGFVATLGVIALVGMIVRNGVILVDQVDRNVSAGMETWNAVAEATVHRLRPILLTAAAAILGMIPIAPQVFWGPMAYAVMGGLAAATVLTLIFLPALIVAWFRVKEPAAAT